MLQLRKVADEHGRSLPPAPAARRQRVVGSVVDRPAMVIKLLFAEAPPTVGTDDRVEANEGSCGASLSTKRSPSELPQRLLGELARGEKPHHPLKLLQCLFGRAAEFAVALALGACVQAIIL